MQERELCQHPPVTLRLDDLLEGLTGLKRAAVLTVTVSNKWV